MNYNEIEACVVNAKAGSKEDLIKLLNQYKPFLFYLNLLLSILPLVPIYPINNAIKFALAAMEKVSGEAKAHSFTGASAAREYSFGARFRNIFSVKRNNSI
jgi:hypothetical protein